MNKYKNKLIKKYNSKQIQVHSKINLDNNYKRISKYPTMTQNPQELFSIFYISKFVFR